MKNALLSLISAAIAFCALTFLPRAVVSLSDRFASGVAEEPALPRAGFLLCRTDPVTADLLESWRSQAAGDYETSADALLSIGIYELYTRKNYPAAEEAFQRLLRSYPSSNLAPAALFECGIAQLSAGDGEGALRSFQLFCSRYPRSWRIPAALMYIALHYRDNGDPERACSILERVAREHPASPQARRAAELARRLYEREGRYEDAARISLLSASCSRGAAAAKALARWVRCCARYKGSEGALGELEPFLPSLRTAHSRRIVLETAYEVAASSGDEKLELRWLAALLESGVSGPRTPALMWRRYELETLLGLTDRASSTLAALARAWPDSPEGRRAEEELDKVLAAGVAK